MPHPFWFAAAFLAVQFGLRLACGSGVQADDGELLVYSQAFAWGYSEQPPLYAWLCRLTFFVTGPSVAGLTFVRVAVLAAGVGFAYLLARQLTNHRGIPALAAVAPVLVLPFSWAAVALLTHSNLLAAAALATVWAVLRVGDHPRTHNYALLGVAVAVGTLSKYNYAWFVVGLTVAALTVPEFRRRLFDVRILISVAVAVALTLPHGLWLAANHAEVTELLRAKTKQDVDPDYFVRVGKGIAELAWTSLGLLPVVGTVVFAFGRTPSEVQAPADKLLGRFFLVVGVLLALMILGLGAGRFHMRWAQPFAVVFAVWWVARVPICFVSLPGVWRFRFALGVAGLALIAGRAVEASGHITNPDRPYSMHTDLRNVADEIRTAHGDRPTLLIHDLELAGLCCHLPDSRIIWTTTTLFAVPSGDGPIVVVWNLDRGPDPPWPLFGAWGECLASHPLTDDPIRTATGSVPLPQLVVPRVAFVRIAP